MAVADFIGNEHGISKFEGLKSADDCRIASSDSVIKIISETDHSPRVIYRYSGDACILVEYGPTTFDLRLRFRVHLLEQALLEANIKGLSETGAGVRSLWIKYHPITLRLNKLIEILIDIERNIGTVDQLILPSRKIKLPIAYDDSWSKRTIEQYMRTVRKEGPYLPDNIAFIAKCNGLKSKDEVFRKHLGTAHMVIGLGDVYLGAPCSIPLDPRSRLVVPKYNPARTFTHEGCVGIGGSYGCIYPMESPGGYQLIGRTLAIWNTLQDRKGFEEAPWLLRPFDRMYFYPVSEDELLELRSSGNPSPEVEESEFRVNDHLDFLALVEAETLQFRATQQEAVLSATVGY